MAIEGLRSPEEASSEILAFNPNDRAELALAAVEGLGRVEDRDKFLDGAKTDLEGLADRGIYGETVLYLPLGKYFTPKDMVEGIDNANYPDGASYPQSWPLVPGHPHGPDRPQSRPLRPGAVGSGSLSYERAWAHSLWFPEDYSTKGYSIAEINRLDVQSDGENGSATPPAHMRVMLEGSPENENPLLQFRKLPYDERCALDDEKTQLDALAAVKAEMESADDGIHVSSANMSMLALLAMQRRLEGKPTPFQRDWARILQLGGRLMQGHYLVGSVAFTSNDELALSLSTGEARSEEGAVVSVGLKQS